MEASHCTRCGSHRDLSDNFCRKCGHPLTVDQVSVHSTAKPVPVQQMPTVTVPIPPAVIRGAAMLALGTGVEWMLRRMAGNAARAAGRSLIPGGNNSPAKQLNAGPREVTVDEILYVRKVQLRR